MKFSEQTWKQRERTLGDPAENAFALWAEAEGIPTIRFGLNRPPMQVSRFPLEIRHMPDYLGYEAFWEVQGCGADQTIKVKHDKLNALLWWDSHVMRVNCWFWNQPYDTYKVVSMDQLFDMCSDEEALALGDIQHTYRTDGRFDQTKPFAALHWETIP